MNFELFEFYKSKNGGFTLVRGGKFDTKEDAMVEASELEKQNKGWRLFDIQTVPNTLIDKKDPPHNV